MGKRNPDQDENLAHRPFERLDELMRSSGIELVKHNKQSQENEHKTDDELFRDAMSRVREIEDYTGMEVERKAPVVVEKKRLSEGLNTLRDITSGKAPIRLQDTQEYVEWRNPAYKQNLTDMLHGGEIAVQDFLDLHGYTVDEAEDEVAHFIRNAIRQGFCCVKIIHGRGLGSPKGPVLKKALILWLRRHYRKHVVAFTSARKCDGGLGAIYVLLRCRVP